MSFRAALVLPLVLVSACSIGGEPDGGIIPAVEAGSIDSGPEPTPDAGRRDAGRRDAGTIDAGPSSGLACESCETDEDCTAGHYCVALPSGGSVCLDTCVPDLPDCPDGFDCVASLITPLPAPVCAPFGERCCVDADGDDHGVGIGCRGPDCDEDDDSVHGSALEVCDGADNDCDGAVDEGDPGGGFVCSTGLTGACESGATECRDGALACVPSATSTDELCDGLDNDCDSMVDEDSDGRALTRPCYDGPSGTAGMGTCAEGVQTCAGGEYRSCVGQITPSPEICDGVDSDCDGVADDGSPGGGFDCNVPGAGICAEGSTQCVDGTVQCVGAIAPGSQAEICDDVDNDCDGTVNDGFPGLGTACTTGLGNCRRGGVVICDAANRAGPPICDAVPATPSPVEVCDYTDDNCNGTVDEGFRSGGVYGGVANCGGCGIDCNLGWPGGAAAVHVTPTCEVSGSSATCGFVCTSGYFDADLIRENGCEFFPEDDTIYVSTPANGGADSGTCGSHTAPCQRIQTGLTRASATGAVRVRVSTGLYNENVALVSGVSVLGGHAHTNWVRDPDVFGTTIRGVDAAVPGAGANDRVVVTAVDITAPTELSGFIIQGVNAGPGGNSIGVYARNSDDDLFITDNDIAPGAAGNGGNGVAGAAGAPGDTGDDGFGWLAQACSSSMRTGPAGGATSCGGGTLTNGGRGGASASPTTTTLSPTRQPTGAVGSTARGGAGGAGGFNMIGQNAPGGGRSCGILDSPIEGAGGTTGTSGSDGGGGAGASDDDGSVPTTQWRGANGAPGTSGQPGGGGGGGGASAGVMTNNDCLFPPSGGGGGAGGCAGSLGAAGSAGGASFAVFILHTTTVAASAMPRVSGNRLRRGTGGRGGDGGTGGGGGEGGGGGMGGPRSGSSHNYDFCMIEGGPGGSGGRGGHAGGGGGGAGGVSYDLWVSRPGSATPSYGGNTFEIPAATNTGGAGGTGGNSSNTAIGLGGAGVAGEYGTIRIGP